MGEEASAASDLRRRGPNRMQDPENATAKHVVPPADWTRAQPGINNGFPQAVAHRGYKAEFPENTMGAFRGAVDVGAHAIETDVHLSKDGVVVIAHDKDLKRCWGVDGLVRDKDWAYLSTLQTLREPRQPLARLLDLLSYLAEPGREAVWIFLDVKIDDDPGELLAGIAAVVASVPAGDWRRRIVLGCWTARHLRLAREILPEFAVAHIGVSLGRARDYLAVPNVAMNMRQEPLFSFGGGRFVDRCQGEGRPLYVWTVNKASWMEWCIEKKMDCVITDDPKHYLAVCEARRGEQAAAGKKGLPAVVRGPRDFVLRVLYFVVISALLGIMPVSKRLGRPKEAREELRKV